MAVSPGSHPTKPPFITGMSPKRRKKKKKKKNNNNNNNNNYYYYYYYFPHPTRPDSQNVPSPKTGLGALGPSPIIALTHRPTRRSDVARLHRSWWTAGDTCWDA